MRLATPIVAVLLAAALLAGCGSSEDGSGTDGSDGTTETATSTAPPGTEAIECDAHATDAEELRATGVACPWARALMFRWQGTEACVPAEGASRSGCTIGPYRCLGAVTDRGVSVSCSRSGRSVAFLARGWSKS